MLIFLLPYISHFHFPCQITRQALVMPYLLILKIWFSFELLYKRLMLFYPWIQFFNLLIEFFILIDLQLVSFWFLRGLIRWSIFFLVLRIIIGVECCLGFRCGSCLSAIGFEIGNWWLEAFWISWPLPCLIVLTTLGCRLGHAQNAFRLSQRCVVVLVFLIWTLMFLIWNFMLLFIVLWWFVYLHSCILHDSFVLALVLFLPFAFVPFKLLEDLDYCFLTWKM